MGASPNALVSCQCCGKVVVEIKWPYSYRYDVMEYVFSSDSCFTEGHEVHFTRNNIIITGALLLNILNGTRKYAAFVFYLTLKTFQTTVA